MIFVRINFPNFAQFEQYKGKSGSRVFLLKARALEPNVLVQKCLGLEVSGHFGTGHHVTLRHQCQTVLGPKCLSAAKLHGGKLFVGQVMGG